MYTAVVTILAHIIPPTYSSPSGSLTVSLPKVEVSEVYIRDYDRTLNLSKKDAMQVQKLSVVFNLVKYC